MITGEMAMQLGTQLLEEMRGVRAATEGVRSDLSKIDVATSVQATKCDVTARDVTKLEARVVILEGNDRRQDMTWAKVAGAAALAGILGTAAWHALFH